MLKDRSQFLVNLPESPGVYLHMDAAGKLLYVGKAKNLKKRVASYFVKTVHDAKTEALVSRIAETSTIVTNNETEALLLEDSLIKKHHPPYNIDLKDNKQYPYFRLAVNEAYPRLEIVRQRKKDGARYFGPYSSSITDTLKSINRIFEVRKCVRLPKKPCVYLQIKQCLGPCIYDVAQEYDQEIERLMKFLQGDYEHILDELKQQMAAAASGLEYERAAELRDRIKQLEKVASQQHVIAPDLVARDIWSYAEDESLVVVVLLIMHNGRIVGSRKFSAKKGVAVDDDWFIRTVESYYQQEARPKEVILPGEYKTGFRADLLQIARKNALQYVQDLLLAQLKSNSPEAALVRLKEVLGLGRVPKRIDCFDISHIQGAETVASMTVLRDGLLAKDQYRKYIIDLTSPDDFAAMEEVLSRRYIRVAEGEAEAPDLIVIDGGKGQLGIAVRVLKKYNLTIPIISIAKRNEELFVPGRANPIVLRRNDPALKAIQTVRDEAHRFAISFHRQRRSKRTLGVLGAVVLCFLAFGFAEDINTKQRELQQIQTELDRQKYLLNQTRRKEQATLRDLYITNRKINTVKGNLNYSQQKLQKHSLVLSQTQEEVTRMSSEYIERQKMFMQRIRENYKRRDVSLWEVLFSQRAFSDAINASYYYTRILQQDVETIDRLKILKTDMLRKKATLEYQKGLIERTHRTIQQQKQQYESQASQQRRLYKDLHAQRLEYERKVDELLRNSKEIEAMIKRLVAQSGSTAKGTGQFIWPLRGQITSLYGVRTHPIFRTKRMHTGLDIGARLGSRVKAADGGTILFAGWWGGYGRAIIIDHGRGYSTVYGHLHQINVEKGQRVEQNQVIGLAGSSGYSTGPHLHFEIRRDGETQDPLRYLPR